MISYVLTRNDENFYEVEEVEYDVAGFWTVRANAQAEANNLNNQILNHRTMLVWGNPVDGFRYMGPITRNNPEMEVWIEHNLKDDHWWYVPLERPAWESDYNLC